LAGEICQLEPVEVATARDDLGDCVDSRDAIDNPHCKEFYSETGSVSYHILQNTVTCNNDCHPYRMTFIDGDQYSFLTATDVDVMIPGSISDVCENTNFGDWVSANIGYHCDSGAICGECNVSLTACRTTNDCPTGETCGSGSCTVGACTQKYNGACYFCEMYGGSIQDPGSNVFGDEYCLYNCGWLS